jgi:hypothetical protein
VASSHLSNGQQPLDRSPLACASVEQCGWWWHSRSPKCHRNTGSGALSIGVLRWAAHSGTWELALIKSSGGGLPTASVDCLGKHWRGEHNIETLRTVHLPTAVDQASPSDTPSWAVFLKKSLFLQCMLCGTWKLFARYKTQTLLGLERKLI